VAVNVKRWLKSLRKLFSQPQSRPSRRTRSATRLLLEGLETRLLPAPVITTIAGTSSYGYNGDGIPATAATLYLPFGTAVDSSGNVFIADSYNSRIREVAKATGNIVTVAGTSSFGYNGDGFAAIYANLYHPDGVAVDASGNLFIADSYDNRIREVVKSTGNIITIAGNGYTGFSGDGGPATSAMLNDPFGVAVDSSGNVFFSDQGNNRVREVVKSTGTIITVAGTGSASYNGDNIPATSAMLNQPNGVAVDGQGNVFISDWHNNRVREVVKSTGTIITFAGTGTSGFTGDGGPATSARVNFPGGVAVDTFGNVFIADSSNERVREVVRATGLITTVAGSGTMGFGGDGFSPTSAAMNLPYAVAVDSVGNLFIADSNNNRVREVITAMGLGGLSPSAWTVNQPGFSSTVSITGGSAPFGNLSATGLPPGLTAALQGSTITLSGTPTAVGTYTSVTLSVQDSSGNTATSTYTVTINAPPALGTLSPNTWTAQVEGYTGSVPVTGGTGTLTLISQANVPPGMTPVVSGSSIYLQGIPSTPGTYNNIQLTVADASGASASGTVSLTITAPALGSILTVAGIGGYSGYNGDNKPANQAELWYPYSVAVDASGNVFIADYYNSRVREIVKATGNIVTVAGTGTNGDTGDGGPATSAQVYAPDGLAIDASGNLFIAESVTHRVREIIKATGIITTVAGNGSATDSGDGGPATSAGIAQPEGLAVDASGNLFIADASGNRVREVVKATGTIITVAGTGTAGFSGDNGPATAAMLNSPYGVAVDASGNLFIGDSNNNRVREVVQATGNIITFAGTGASGYSGDGGPATSAKLYNPTGLAVDAYGDVLIADTFNSYIRIVEQYNSGTIVTLAGSGYPNGYSGDGGPANSARLFFPYGVAVDATSGNVFIADTYNYAVREVLTIPPPVMGPLSPTQWTVNQGGYSGNISINNFVPSSGTFLTTSGMPPGLSVSTNVNSAGNYNGILITGTPTAAGTYSTNLTIRGMSGAPFSSRTFTITINPAPTPGALSVSQWTRGQAGFSGTIPVSGGTGPLTVAAQANLPPGLSATTVGSLVTFTGTPTTTGTYSNVQVTVQDAAGALSTATYSITINAAPTLGSASNTLWTANQTGVSTIPVSGGTAPYSNLTVTGLMPGLTATLSGGTITISGAPPYAGFFTAHVSVKDSAGATASGVFFMSVAGPAARFAVISTPTALTAGASASFTVTALDAMYIQAPSYRGTVYFSSSDPAGAFLPASYTFTAADQGSHTFTVTLKTAGSQQLYANDPAGSIYGLSMPISVSPAALDHLAVVAPQYVASYYGFNVTVSAQDAYNNTIPNYTGTIHFTSSDGAAGLPADYTYTASDQGSHTFSATLQTVGTQTIAVNDRNNAAVTGTALVQDLDYIPGLHFVITPSVTTATAGAPFDVTLTALDQFNNVAVHYDGTVDFSGTDHGSGVVLPTDYTFTAADAGVHTFASGVTLVTAGNQALSVVDTSTVTTGGYGLSSANITVNPAEASVFTITGLPATVIRGMAQTFTVTSKDPYGNIATGYSDTVHFTSSDPQAVLPPDSNLTAGTGTFHVTFASLGTQSLSVTDTVNGAVTGTQGGVTVNPAPVVRLAVTGFPSSTTADVTGTFSVAAIDANGYVATGYTGTVHFTSSDPLAVLPADVALTNGTGSFSATLKTAATQSLTATDTGNGSLNGSEDSITVTPAAATTLMLVGFPTSTTAGVAATATVIARDAFGNVVTGYTGTVHLTSSDVQAALPADYTFTAADAGSHTFPITFKTAATQSLTVADSTGTLNSASQSGIVVNAGAVASLTGSAPDNSIPNSGYPFVVWALDAYGNPVQTYMDTVHFSSSDPQAVLPADYTYTSGDAGSHNFVATFKTVGRQTVTVTDNGTADVSAFQFSVNVQAGQATGLALAGFPSPATAGVAGTFTVRAHDLYGNTATGYTGTVHFTSSDAVALLPADYTFTPVDAGVHTFSATFIMAGGQGLWVQDTQNNFTAAQYAISVDPAAASTLAVTAYNAVTTAGVVDNVTLTALDPYGNVVTGYSGTVHFSSSDGQASLPADYTFAAGDAGVHTFAVTLKTAGAQAVSFQDAQADIGASANISVTAAAASYFVLSGFPSPTTAGSTNSFTVHAYDPYVNTAVGYTGTVHFTSSDAEALLPANYTFTAADAGVHIFLATLVTAGSQSLGAQDAQNNVTGTQAAIGVTPAPASRLVATAYSGSATAGAVDNVTLTALDPYGNVATGYSGTAHFSSSDGQASLLADYTFAAGDAGVHTFAVVLKTAGTQMVSFQDAQAGFGNTLNISVSAAAAGQLVVSGFPSPTTAGFANSFTVHAFDPYGNTAVGYTGTAHFTSSDAAALLPADYTFTAADAGVHTFSASLLTAGSQSLGVHDAQNNLTGAQAAISVTPAAASRLVVTASSASTSAGVVDNLTITAQDPYGNVATGYMGTVHVSSSDSQASLPADYTFTAGDAGIHTFAVTLKTAAAQTVSFQDAKAGFNTSANISVTAAAASRFVLSGFPSATTAGTVQSLTLTTLDAYGNLATGYTGTVHFSSSDSQAVLPADYSFSASDHGVHTFSVSLCTAGTQSLAATDRVTPALTASQTGISVVAGAMSKFVVSGYPATTAGTSHSLTVAATDAYGNVVTSYRGQVHFTSSDAQASLPGNYTFSAGDNGVHTFSATLKTAGSQSLIVTDTVTPGITGKQSGIAVTAAAATHLSITAPATASIGVAVSVTVTALDAYGNIATGYLGTIHFTSNDSKAILPSNYTFVAADAGVHTFTVTFKSTGTETLTATDTHTGSIKGSASVKAS
jgi:sugar lactone lactonase YvrE